MNLRDSKNHRHGYWEEKIHYNGVYKGNYKNDKRDGIWVGVSTDGRFIYEKGYFINGIKEGGHYSYIQNKIKTYEYYHNNKLIYHMYYDYDKTSNLIDVIYYHEWLKCSHIEELY